MLLVQSKPQEKLRSGSFFWWSRALSVSQMLFKKQRQGSDKLNIHLWLPEAEPSRRQSSKTQMVTKIITCSNLDSLTQWMLNLRCASFYLNSPSAQCVCDHNNSVYSLRSQQSWKHRKHQEHCWNDPGCHAGPHLNWIWLMTFSQLSF